MFSSGTELYFLWHLNGREVPWTWRCQWKIALEISRLTTSFRPDTFFRSGKKLQVISCDEQLKMWCYYWVCSCVCSGIISSLWSYKELLGVLSSVVSLGSFKEFQVGFKVFQGLSRFLTKNLVVDFWSQKLPLFGDFWGQKLCRALLILAVARNLHFLTISWARNLPFWRFLGPE